MFVCLLYETVLTKFIIEGLHKQMLHAYLSEIDALKHQLYTSSNRIIFAVQYAC